MAQSVKVRLPLVREMRTSSRLFENQILCYIGNGNGNELNNQGNGHKQDQVMKNCM